MVLIPGVRRPGTGRKGILSQFPPGRRSLLLYQAMGITPSPHKPRIVEHRVPSGFERMDVRRLTHASEAEGTMDINIEKDWRPSSSDSELEIVDRRDPKPGPSKPLKRARGRPRKDGSGPFKEPSPTDSVRRAMKDGDVRAVYLAAVASQKRDALVSCRCAM